ncbi:DUF1810 domain-containing protein [Dysgonomonas sp. 520]|uniref:DUF1810 domain-containing protein n=1 Tax=Dysgonomonas sp. 520 TaxID=2302931 RepID=UPI0013D19571|nr:DUF1810 domain-containing protein [Dysgonomonas sp. 520]NDW10496.1 DUF1810 domain-containing protein [Dysgonomonas sp. 520]
MKYNLQRFIDAQNNIYEQVIKELKRGSKTTHWMWFVFPQIKGLGYSTTAIFYSISNLEEAKAYMENSILNNRLIECCLIILELKDKSANNIFGYTDAMKLKSSMTLFSLASDNLVFNQVLDMYFKGEKDNATLRIVNQQNI